MNYKLKINKPDELEQKEVIEIYTSEDIELDYSSCNSIGVDTEFLSLNLLNDKLCVIQISSVVNNQKRVEIINVFDKNPSSKLIDLFKNKNIEKIFHYSKADLPRIENFIQSKVEGKIFDTYIASLIVLTNINEYSLEYLIQYLVDPKFQKSKKLSSSEWDLAFERWNEEQIEYCARDVIYLDTIKNKLVDIAKRRGRIDLLDKSMKIIKTTIDLYANGYDVGRLFN